MTILLLTHTKSSLEQELRLLLPAEETLLSATSIEEALSVLHTAASGRVSLIVLDSELNTVDSCKQLREEPLTAVFPIIAILSDPAQQEAAMQAGATSYMLLPLTPTRIQSCLAPYVEQKYDLPFTVLLSTLEDVKEGIPFVQALIEHQEMMAVTLGAVTSTIYLGNDKPPEADADNILSLPLLGEQRHMGILRLEYEHPIALTPAERQTIDTVVAIIGHLLEVSSLQEESQFYATQIAFLILIAKMLAEQSEMNEILSLTLEHAVSLLNASTGDIWLYSSSGEQLESASSLSASVTYHPHSNIPVDRGILGWVVTQRKPAHLDALADAPQFDADVDEALLNNGRFLLAIPLHHQKVLGAIVLQSHAHPFSKQDVMLLEGIASLLASAVANAMKVEELRDYTAQQQALYEMSHQIAGGLDLQNTLNRTLGWAVRLVNIEIGLLWIIDAGGNHLRLSASHGLTDLPEEEILIDGCILGDFLKTAHPVTINDPKNDARYAHRLEKRIGFIPHNLLSVPLIYQGKPIGYLCLLNKIGTDFDKTDADLLATATEMITLAIGNARLHAKTIALMDERERLYKQALQSERLATVGRLTASLAHEINNPMQAIKGAMALALEELDDPVSLREYLELAIDQADRVATLVDRMRQIYQPHTDAPEAVDLNHVLQETITVARKEMRRQNTTLEISLLPDLPVVWASANQLHLVFLNTLLNLGDMIGKHGGGKLFIRTYATPSVVRIEFTTAVSLIPIASLTKLLHGEAPEEMGFGLSLSRDTIIAHGGTLDLIEHDEQVTFRIELPTLDR